MIKMLLLLILNSYSTFAQEKKEENVDYPCDTFSHIGNINKYKARISEITKFKDCSWRKSKENYDVLRCPQKEICNEIKKDPCVTYYDLANANKALTMLKAKQIEATLLSYTGADGKVRMELHTDCNKISDKSCITYSDIDSLQLFKTAAENQKIMYSIIEYIKDKSKMYSIYVENELDCTKITKVLDPKSTDLVVCNGKSGVEVPVTLIEQIFPSKELIVNKLQGKKLEGLNFEKLKKLFGFYDFSDDAMIETNPKFTNVAGYNIATKHTGFGLTEGDKYMQFVSPSLSNEETDKIMGDVLNILNSQFGNKYDFKLASKSFNETYSTKNNSKVSRFRFAIIYSEK